MIIDCHNHIGYRIGAYFSGEELIEWMGKAGVDKAVAFAQCELPIDNEYVASIAEKYPDRVIGFALLNPWDYRAVEDLSRLTTQRGLKGLKLNPTRHGFAMDRAEILDPLFEVAAYRKIPIIAHGKDDLFSMPGKFEAMAKRHPKVNLICAHMGVDRALGAAIRAAARCPNLYLDTSSVSPNAIREALKGVSAEKIIMGTDAPWGRFELSIEAVRQATDDPVKRDLIMHQNILRVLSGC
jgi:predicted TIM-barrel fold metal-dependent hydrolase